MNLYPLYSSGPERLGGGTSRGRVRGLSEVRLVPAFLVFSGERGVVSVCVSTLESYLSSPEKLGVLLLTSSPLFFGSALQPAYPFPAIDTAAWFACLL